MPPPSAPMTLNRLCTICTQGVHCVTYVWFLLVAAGANERQDHQSASKFVDGVKMMQLVNAAGVLSNVSDGGTLSKISSVFHPDPHAYVAKMNVTLPLLTCPGLHPSMATRSCGRQHPRSQCRRGSKTTKSFSRPSCPKLSGVCILLDQSCSCFAFFTSMTLR
jgi:hypothetical protein